MLEINTSLQMKLNWYYYVANNKLPAKYLICSRIPVKFNSEDSEENLWLVHKEATEEFVEVFEGIKNGTLDFTTLLKPELSLMDLNITLVNKMLSKCQFCEWLCNVDRTKEKNTKLGTCKLRAETKVGTFFHHRGEELIYRGTKGSGTIFFTSCNMRCAFCQNADISTDKDRGTTATPELVSSMVYKLGVEGCHNINFVGGEPTVNFHTIVKAIGMLLDKEKIMNSNNIKLDSLNPEFILYGNQPSKINFNGKFNVPMLWNSNFFMTLKTMKILRTIIDVWLPDFKFSNNTCSIKLARTPKYFETITRNLIMLRDWNESFSIRHLIMPNHVECCSKEIFEWLQNNIPNVLINVMDQYHPDCYANPKSSLYKDKYSEISRYLTKEEILKAYTLAKYYNLCFKELSFEKNVSGLTI